MLQCQGNPGSNSPTFLVGEKKSVGNFTKVSRTTCFNCQCFLGFLCFLDENFGVWEMISRYKNTIFQQTQAPASASQSKHWPHPIPFEYPEDHLPRRLTPRRHRFCWPFWVCNWFNRKPPYFVSNYGAALNDE